ncbi:hypothetical protein KIH27_14255, partial [Mycobacterium sp. M1]|nr:hypothetical protein [Mycolicibacter acidiphilus]
MRIKALIVSAGIATALSNVACAHAEPSHFPDLSHYTPVNPNDYIITIDTPGISTYGTYFLTPGGVFCAIEPGMDGRCHSVVATRCR